MKLTILNFNFSSHQASILPLCPQRAWNCNMRPTTYLWKNFISEIYLIEEKYCCKLFFSKVNVISGGCHFQRGNKFICGFHFVMNITQSFGMHTVPLFWEMWWDLRKIALDHSRCCWPFENSFRTLCQFRKVTAIFGPVQFKGMTKWLIFRLLR